MLKVSQLETSVALVHPGQICPWPEAELCESY